MLLLDRCVLIATGVALAACSKRVRSLYPERITVEPHRYTTGHYLIAAPEAPADSAFRIIFETDGTRVTRSNLPAFTGTIHA